MRPPTPLLSALILPALVLATTVSAQSVDGSASAPPSQPTTTASRADVQTDIALEASSLIAPPVEGAKVQVIAAGTAAYQFRSDLDSGGDMALTRFALGTQVRVPFTDQLSLGVELGYRFDRYSFRGDVLPGMGSGFKPWRDIHTVGLGIVPTFALDDHWSISAGFIAQAAGEAQADVDDATAYGGIVGVSYRVSKDLLLGGGVAIVKPIEDDVDVFPQIVLDWRISEQLRLSSRGGPTTVLGGGMELVYQPRPAIELALGARWEYSRFRLSRDGSVRDGIGEVEGLPIWLRASWWPMETLRLDLMGGVTVAGEVQINDDRGRVLASSDFDPAPFIAAYFIWSF